MSFQNELVSFGNLLKYSIMDFRNTEKNDKVMKNLTSQLNGHYISIFWKNLSFKKINLSDNL